jgi:hypothetical protein
MNKTLNKIVLECILTVCIIFVPFILANYFITVHAESHSDLTGSIINIVLNIIQLITIIASGLVIGNRNKTVIIENKYSAKKYLIVSLIGIAVVVLMIFTGIYTDLYYITAETLNIFDKAPLIVICWEQLMNGKFLFELLLCIALCFVHRYGKKQEI